MSEETTQTQPAAETSPQPTLEQIASEINVEQQVQNFTAQPQQQTQTVQAPDPVADPDNYANYARQQTEILTNLDRTVRTLNEKIQSQERDAAQAKVNADVDKAVSQVNKKLNVDPMMAEIALEKEYRTNPSFKKIWDNRDRNPGALEKALDVLSDKFSPIFSIRQDPQLTENQLAARKSQQALGRTPAKGSDDEWKDLSPQEFEAKWNRMKRG